MSLPPVMSLSFFLFFYYHILSFLLTENVLVVRITLIFSDLSCRLCCLEDFHDSAWCPFLSDTAAFPLKTELDCVCGEKRKKNKAKMNILAQRAP